MLIGLTRQNDKLQFVKQSPPLWGNVVNLSVQQFSVGGDAHIAPQEMLRFFARLGYIRLRARAFCGHRPLRKRLNS